MVWMCSYLDLVFYKGTMNAFVGWVLWEMLEMFFFRYRLVQVLIVLNFDFARLRRAVIEFYALFELCVRFLNLVFLVVSTKRIKSGVQARQIWCFRVAAKRAT